MFFTKKPFKAMFKNNKYLVKYTDPQVITIPYVYTRFCKGRFRIDAPKHIRPSVAYKV